MLTHPADLVRWRRWHELQHPARHVFRSARSRLRPRSDVRVDVMLPDLGSTRVLVAIEATHASFHQAVASALDHLSADDTAIVAPVGWQPPAAYAGHQRLTVPLPGLSTFVAPAAVLAAGHFTEIGAAAFGLADQHRAPFFVSQHGALTPFAPPLPRAAHLLAWSDADGAFWRSGRKDVKVATVGSQLLWVANGLGSTTHARTVRPTSADPVPLVYLGQGHAAEISRARLVHAALTTCRRHNAIYRPHPSELDVTSRAVLAAYTRAGIAVDASGIPLVDLEAPIVSVFSTGVLEAAARGRDAWVDFPRPPAWLGEFWERYGMHRLGSSSTPAPQLPRQEPARRIAEIVSDAAS